MKEQVNFIIQKQDMKHYLMINWGYGFSEVKGGKKKYLPLRMSTGVSITYPSKFDKEKQRMVTGEPNHLRKNAELDKLESAIIGYVNNYKFTQDRLPSPTEIKIYLESEGEIKSTTVTKTWINDIVDQYCEVRLKAKKGFSAKTVRNYDQFKTKINLYEEKYKVKIYIEEITRKVYNDFVNFVQDLPGDFRQIDPLVSF